MKNRIDLNLDEVVYISIFYHIPDSRVNLLNGYDFYFWWGDSSVRFFIRALFGEVSNPKPCFPLGGWPLSNRNMENALDMGLKVGVLFIDFRKAFDTVNHTILLEKQKAIGISGDLFS